MGRNIFLTPRSLFPQANGWLLHFCPDAPALPGNCFALNFLSRRIIFPRLQLNLHFSTRHLDPAPMKSERKRLGPKWP